MKVKRNKKSYRWFLCGLILVVVLTISLIRGSRAGYKSTSTIELTSGIVKYSSYDFNLISVYIDEVEQDKSSILPSTIANYTINESETYCFKDSKNNKDNNAKISINILGELVIKGISKGSKCILSLNTRTEEAKTMSELLKSHYIIKNDRSADNKDFNVPFTKTTYGVLYSAQDDDGTSYYFAGNPLDNWVEFGGYYWRIIRINGNGSIRMIYQGRIEDENGNILEPQTTGVETQITVNSKNTHTFNDSYNNNAYVGYWYQTEVLRGLQNPSNAYIQLDNWFSSSNIKQGTSYFNLIDPDAGFCGDRQPSTSTTEINGSGGSGTATTYYGAYVRLRPEGSNPTATSAAVTPTLSCANNDDLYTYSGAKQGVGNHKLTNPAGMINADEVTYAGMVYGVTSVGNYLDTDSHYWTMSPHFFYNSYAGVFAVWSTGYLDHFGVHGTYGVRPVINLRYDTQLLVMAPSLTPTK